MTQHRIINTYELLQFMRLFYTKQTVAEKLDVSMPTVHRWLDPDEKATASARYVPNFQKAISGIVYLLEEYGLAVQDYPKPELGEVSSSRSRDGRLIKACMVEINRLLEQKARRAPDMIRLVEKATGAKRPTIRKAAAAVGVVYSNRGFGPGSEWWWELPVDKDSDPG